MTDLKYIHTYLPENEWKEAEEKLKKKYTCTIYRW